MSVWSFRRACDHRFSHGMKITAALMLTIACLLVLTHTPNPVARSCGSTCPARTALWDQESHRFRLFQVPWCGSGLVYLSDHGELGVSVEQPVFLQVDESEGSARVASDSCGRSRGLSCDRLPLLRGSGTAKISQFTL
ncbi:hypothetical protein Hamer_G025358 [Homarus americanus]|uniref:Uncharacterized protein n=1 Tax=Homarus americanus TaxID=6706 RepID=A0A8J5JXT8_HOMAM|nr:hypothetical protein Hamer_G025358 [Homarus americanus]